MCYDDGRRVPRQCWHNDRCWARHCDVFCEWKEEMVAREYKQVERSELTFAVVTDHVLAK